MPHIQFLRELPGDFISNSSIVNDGDKLLRRLRQGGGGRYQSQDVQVMYASQVLQCCMPEEALDNAQKVMQTTCR